MTDQQEPNPFCTSLPTQLRAWDSTSLQAYLKCPRYYFYSIVEGWRLDGHSVHLDWGRVYHASVEEFDKARGRGVSKADAIDVAFAFALEHTGTRYFYDVAGNEVEQVLAVRNAWYPWPIEDNKKTRYTLLRAVVWYCDEQPEAGGVQPYVFPDGRPAVELSFQIPLPLANPDSQLCPDCSGLRIRSDGAPCFTCQGAGMLVEPYLLCGHIDELATTGGTDVFPKERKTTGVTIGSYYFDQYSPHVQIDTYDLAFHVLYPEFASNEVMLEATQTGVNFARFHRQMIHTTGSRREEHLEDLMYWIKRAEADAVAYQNGRPYPMNKFSCHGKGRCIMADICNKDAAVRGRFLKGGYVQQPWNPLAER